MNQNLVPVDQPPLTTIGLMANAYTAHSAFADYQTRLTANTKRRHEADLSAFAECLKDADVTVSADELMSNPQAWAGVTYGLVETFVRWMLQKGYAIGSVNVRLATVKAYCKQAAKAGVLSPDAYGLIKLVQGYSPMHGRNVDQSREVTRVGEKKAEPVSISKEQADRLKNQPDTPQGRRDALLMCLLLDHGLRCGEVAALTPDALNVDECRLTFYRQKVDKLQAHELTKDTLLAAIRYFAVCTPLGRLLMGSRKSGKLEGIMSERAITDRVCELGKKAGLSGLSAHDCRHYWATSAVRGGTDIPALQNAGGWASPVMPLRYVEASKVANEGVKLG